MWHKKILHTIFASTLLFSTMTSLAQADPAAEAPAPSSKAHLVNPYVEYPDVPSLEKAIGFPVLYLPMNLYAAYHPPVHAFSIRGRVADLRFISAFDDSKVTLRTAILPHVKTEDISGCQGIEWQPLIQGRDTGVYIAVLSEKNYLARWTSRNFVFSLAMKDADEKRFIAILNNFVVVSDRFSKKYSSLDFKLNKPTENINLPSSTTAPKKPEAAPLPPTKEQLKAQEKLEKEQLKTQKKLEKEKLKQEEKERKAQEKEAKRLKKLQEKEAKRLQKEQAKK